MRIWPDEHKRMSTLSTNKILVVIQYWAGDRDQAIKLARLLADLEPRHSELADVCFVARFDSSHDTSAVRHVSTKFNCYTYVSRRRGMGWPHGCNSLFFGGLEYVYHSIMGKKMPHYKAVLVLGADTTPLEKDWLARIHEAWDSRMSGVYVAGAMLPAAGRDHINGDCILLSTDPKFLKWLAVDVGDVTTTAGWDWHLAGQFSSWGWQNFPIIKSAWNRKIEFTELDWLTETSAGTVMFHGQKGDSLLDLARKKLL